MDLKHLFGKKLKKIRTDRDLTQEKFSEIIGVDPGFIGMLEIGKKAPSFKTLEKIHQNLNVSYYELFDFDETHSMSSIITELQRELEGVDTKTLKHIISINKELISFLKMNKK